MKTLRNHLPNHKRILLDPMAAPLSREDATVDDRLGCGVMIVKGLTSPNPSPKHCGHCQSLIMGLTAASVRNTANGTLTETLERHRCLSSSARWRSSFWKLLAGFWRFLKLGWLPHSNSTSRYILITLQPFKIDQRPCNCRGPRFPDTTYTCLSGSPLPNMNFQSCIAPSDLPFISSPMFAISWITGCASNGPQKWRHMGLSENSVPLHPMVLLIIIPILNGYFIGGIPHFKTYPYSPCLKWVTYSKPTQLKSEAPRVSEVCSLLRCPSPTRLGQWPVFQASKNISAIGISIGFEADFNGISNKKAGIFNKFNKTGMLNSNIKWLVVVICPKQPVIWIGHPKWKWKKSRNLQTDHQSKLFQTHHPRIFSHFFNFFSNLHEGCWGPGWSHSRVLNVLMLQLLQIFLVNQRFTIFPHQTV